jgi:Zn-dependent protease with chaperone function
MNFVRRELGDAAEASSGGGETGMAREILLMGGALLALVLGLWYGIAWTIELTLPLISPGTEHAWFGDFTPPNARAAATLSAERQAAHARVTAVLARLAADPAVPSIPYRAYIIPGDEPNAFAFPGGAIGVTEGLLDVVDEEVPLAFVLGHELGHFAQRDHLRGVGRQLGRQLAWALIFGEGGDLLGSHLATLLDLQHSRGQESGADLFGLELVHRRYGTTAGTDRLFAWLETRDRNPRWLEMLQTHPVPANRLEEMRTHAARLGAQPAP